MSRLACYLLALDVYLLNFVNFIDNAATMKRSRTLFEFSFKPTSKSDKDNEAEIEEFFEAPERDVCDAVNVDSASEAENGDEIDSQSEDGSDLGDENASISEPVKKRKKNAFQDSWISFTKMYIMSLTEEESFYLSE